MSAIQNIIGVFRCVISGPNSLSKKSNNFLGIWPREHAERSQNTSDQLLEMCPMTRGQATPIVIILSDANSGGQCDHVQMPKKSPDFLDKLSGPLKRQTTRINHPTSLLRRGCKPAMKEQPSDTIFSSQCRQNRHCKSSAKLLSLQDEFFIAQVFLAHSRTGHLRWPGLRGRAASAATATWPCEAWRLRAFLTMRSCP